jgi:hypothetical protein
MALVDGEVEEIVNDSNHHYHYLLLTRDPLNQIALNKNYVEP